MISRTIANKVEELLTKYPIVSITGPRQSGKTGNLFENLVITELMKKSLNRGRRPQFYFWRDTAQHEIDLLIQNGIQLEAIEIKSGKTIQQDYFKGLNYLKKINPPTNTHIIYGGDQFQKRSDATVYGFNHLAKLNF